MWYKVIIVVCESEKLLHTFHIGRWLPVSNGSHLIAIHTMFTWAHHMAQIFYVRFAKFTFFNLAYNLCLQSRSNTLRRWDSCSSSVLLNTSISSKYTKMKSSVYPCITEFMSHWKVLSALQSPSGKTVYSNKPYRVTKAVFSHASGASQTWWYPLARSIALRHIAFDNLSRRSSILGRG